MSFFDIEGNWNIKMDAGSNTPAPFSLELTYGNVVYPQGGGFNTGFYHYHNNSIIMSLNDNSSNNNTLFFGLLSANGQLEGAFRHILSMSTGIWAASKNDVEMSPVINSGIENYDLNGQVFEDARGCSPCPYGAIYTFSNPPGGNGLIRRVELQIKGTDQTIAGSYFTYKFHKDGPQFVGLDFPMYNRTYSLSFGGVLEMDQGRLAIKGLAMNSNDIFTTWKALQR